MAKSSFQLFLPRGRHLPEWVSAVVSIKPIFVAGPLVTGKFFRSIGSLGLFRVLFKVALSLGFEDVFSRHWHFLSFALSFKVEADKGMGEVL